MNDTRLSACPCCGLVQCVGAPKPGMLSVCCRCATKLPRSDALRKANTRALALTVAALVLYPFAVGLPIMRIEKFGHLHESSIIQGTVTLFESGHLVIAVIILLCSVVLPVGKLLALFVLSVGARVLSSRHRAVTYRIVEWTGRWGMLDVLLVALLVAAVKVGDLVQVSIGPAAVAFTCCVILSLAATASFDPHQFWEPVDDLMRGRRECEGNPGATA